MVKSCPARMAVPCASAVSVSISPTERWRRRPCGKSEGLLAAIFAQAQVDCLNRTRWALPDGQRPVLRHAGPLARRVADLAGQDVTHPDDLARNLPLFMRTVETGEAFTIDKRYLRSDGTCIWAATSVSRIVDERISSLASLRSSWILPREGRPSGRFARRGTRPRRRTGQVTLSGGGQPRPAPAGDVGEPVSGPAQETAAFTCGTRSGRASGEQPERTDRDAERSLEVARLDAGIVRAEPCAFPLNDLLQRLYGEFQRLAQETACNFMFPEAPWVVRSDPLLVELILRT